MRPDVGKAEVRTILSVICKHGSGVAGRLNLLAAHAQPGLGGLNPAVHMLAKHLSGETMPH